jgi:orotidine-5'-phosphate decarboxylase
VTEAAQSFGERLSAVFVTAGHLCVGIDPHPYLLDQWNLPDSGKGLREFGLRVVEAASGAAGIVKPQVAFFERHGSLGYSALEATLAAARDAGLIVIADAKRGDLGTSVEAYAQAWLTPGAALEADAMTVSAFQGVGSLEAPMTLAREHGKGLFVLAATSNPESFATQTATVRAGDNSPLTVAASIVADVNKSNVSAHGKSELGKSEIGGSGHGYSALGSSGLGSSGLGSSGLGSFGVVIGATVRLVDFGLAASDLAITPILAPGFGFQGAGFDSLLATYGEASANTVVSSSRGILESGPGGISAAIRAQAEQLAGAFAQ